MKYFFNEAYERNSKYLLVTADQNLLETEHELSKGTTDVYSMERVFEIEEKLQKFDHQSHLQTRERSPMQTII